MIKNFLIIIVLSISTLIAKPIVPKWVNNAVFYQIYPQTFKDTDGDGIGDLNGIISKLDYVESLGVNALWLSPFYESPFMDAGYDVADFYKVDSRYGNNDIARKMFEEGHKRGIKIIIDFVVGHTSIDHPWFKASCMNKEKYKNWYIWTDNTWITPKEFAGKFVQGYAPRDGSYMTNFFWCQPKLNYGFDKDEIKYDWQLSKDHPDVMALKKEMQNVLVYWLEMGADGFRVDMAGSSGKEFWLETREMFDEKYPEAFLISEWGKPEDAMKAGFHADFMHWYKGYDDLFHKKWFTRNDETNSFFGPEGKGNITDFLTSYLDQYEKTKNQGYISIPVDNHDMVRVKNWGRDDRDLEIIYAFQMTFPGVPFVYYGDEIGMRQLPLDNELAVEGSYGTRSGNRTPMQWDNSSNFGFSTADKEKLYLPVDTEKNAPNVANSEKEKSSLIHITRKLIAMRKKEKALQSQSDFEILYAKTNKYPLIYKRELDGDKILVILNPSKNPVNVEIGINVDNKLSKIMGDGVKIKQKNGYTKVLCKGRSYGIYKFN